MILTHNAYDEQARELRAMLDHRPICIICGARGAHGNCSPRRS